jgi:DnaJ-class molecular chaperone
MMVKCSKCNGKGKIQVFSGGIMGPYNPYTKQKKCDACDGRGIIDV